MTTIDINDVHHRYGSEDALRGVSLTIAAGEVFALLGPNGSGKTTLFRLLSTLMRLQQGRIQIAGVDVASDPLRVRQKIGVVFQAPSLDKKLTVQENIDYHGALFGLSGQALSERREELLRQFDLVDRRQQRCEKLSGGLKRRVEVAKGILHRPAVLLLDEPSTGLDPLARIQLWQVLKGLAAEGTTILLTTHLLEEAEKADRIAILDAGSVIAEGRPERLRSELGEGVVAVMTEHPDPLMQWLTQELGIQATALDNQVRIASTHAQQLLPQLLPRLGDAVQSITIGRPSLEDVFIERTGHRFDRAASAIRSKAEPGA